MQSTVINLPRLMAAGLAAGAWVVVSGMLMALAFGYRDMKLAFDAIGLATPQGLGPMLTHTLVRLILAMTIVALFAIMSRVWPPGQAVVAAAGVAWILAAVLPYAVIAQWGLFGWSLAAKLWAWSAGEFLIAALVGHWLYRP